MELQGPDCFHLTFKKNSKRFEIRCPNGDDKVRGRAAKRGFKLYVFSYSGSPIYIGVTRQSLRARLRFGWTANGKAGYHGYEFRRFLNRAKLNVWYLEGKVTKDTEVFAETIEAEIVFLLRLRGQWPKYQTEIHFHRSTRRHRRLAEKILSHYG